MVTLLRLAACSVPLLIGLTSRCFAHWARASCAPRHCHPYQFPLKSCGFSGAETARKRFLLWKMGFSDAKIAPSPPYTPPGTIKTRKGFGSTIRNSRLAALPLARLLCSLDFRFARFRHWRRRSSVPLALSLGFFDSLHAYAFSASTRNESLCSERKSLLLILLNWHDWRAAESPWRTICL